MLDLMLAKAETEFRISAVMNSQIKNRKQKYKDLGNT